MAKWVKLGICEMELLTLHFYYFFSEGIFSLQKVTCFHFHVIKSFTFPQEACCQNSELLNGKAVFIFLPLAGHEVCQLE